MRKEGCKSAVYSAGQTGAPQRDGPRGKTWGLTTRNLKFQGDQHKVRTATDLAVISAAQQMEASQGGTQPATLVRYLWEKGSRRRVDTY